MKNLSNIKKVQITKAILFFLSKDTILIRVHGRESVNQMDDRMLWKAIVFFEFEVTFLFSMLVEK